MKKMCLSLLLMIATLTSFATDYSGRYVGTLTIGDTDYDNSAIDIVSGTLTNTINFILPNFVFAGSLNVGDIFIPNVPVDAGSFATVTNFPYYISAQIAGNPIGYVGISFIDYENEEEDVHLFSKFTGDDIACVLMIQVPGMDDIPVLFNGTKEAATGYQAPNAGFEEWESVSYSKKVLFTTTTINGNEPVSWNSFLTGTGTYKGTACGSDTPNQLVQNAGRTGSEGSSSAKISANSIANIAVANGNLTTGCVNMSSMSASDASGNYNYTNVSGGQALAFSGHPDTMKIWVKTSISSDSHKAKVTSILHSAGEYHDPTNTQDQVNMEVAKAEHAFNLSSWTELTIPFTYYNNGQSRSGADAAYMLVNFTTNQTAGVGTSGDALWIDDLEYVYNSSLTQLTIDGDAVTFDQDGHANVNKLWSDTQYSIAVTTDGQAAKTHIGYDPNNATITVVVIADNFGADASNYHTYTIQMVAPKYARAVTADKYGTICLPAAVAADKRSGAEFYSIAGTRKSGANVTSIVLEEVAADAALAAGTPYIFKATAAQLDITMNGTLTDVQPATGLVGNLGETAEVPTGDNIYILSKNQLHKVGVTGVTVGTNRAYIDLSGVSEAPAAAAGRRVVVDVEGANAATAIEDVESTVEIDWNKPVFNVLGQQVGRGTTGVLIQNGIKFIVR